MFKKTVVSLFILSFFLTASALAETPRKEELPLFGGIPRTVEEKRVDKEFTDKILNQAGSKNKAAEQLLELAWQNFFRGDLRMAAINFNQVWLVDKENRYLFNGFGSLAKRKGKPAEAFTWFQKGAEAGDPAAQYNLAGLYFSGEGIEQDHVQAAKWYERAALQNFSWAQNMTGICYEYGLGVTQDSEKAAQWYSKADASKDPGPAVGLRKANQKNAPQDGETVTARFPSS